MTIDRLVEELHLGRGDLIKMDIGGTACEALRGGILTLSRDVPTLKLDMYHLPDDTQVLPWFYPPLLTRLILVTL